MKTTTTRGLVLEQQIEQYLLLNHVQVQHASAEQDKYQAIDLWIEGLPVQVTLGTWQTKLGLEKIKAKWDWTQFQSQRKAILVVFDMNTINKITMFKNMVKGLVQLRRAGHTNGVILVDDAGFKICNATR